MKTILFAALLTSATLAHAQAPSSPAKKELVAKMIQLQQPGIEGMARQLVQQPAALMMQEADRAMRSQIPTERRESVGKTIEAAAKRYMDEAFPLLRERAVKLAPSVLAPAIEEKFSEDELRQIVAWMESPTSRKLQQFNGEIQASFVQKLVADARPVIDPKVEALNQNIRAALGMPAAGASAPSSASAVAPKPAAKPSSK